ncbi:hypothetical protein FS749_005111 [Ceratobasidium sp. UAMH 11750]|nr:hypothetical protein FS749_005111 [Ceratobasidium sp. UAMH 11750]
MPALRGLCTKFSLPWKNEDKKNVLMERLVGYYSKEVKVVTIPEPPRPEGDGPILGMERVAEIKNDMRRTNLPSWLKKPPVNFATVDHGKLASEEYKSLALVSLPITLVRLRSAVAPEIQEYFDHFLHLSVVVRVLSYQSLTKHDIFLFEYHYQQYVNHLKRLYPFNSVTPVQHLGLHIPYFLRKLGPATRYSENTCEMFIGMLEEITTNSRIGQLEQTLHRELLMAAKLKAMIDKWNFSDVLEPFAEVIEKFLETRYAGGTRPSSTTWHTKHKGDAMIVDIATFDALSLWAQANNHRAFSRRLHVCEQLRRGHVVYQPFMESRNNSAILFRPPGTSVPAPGRIEAILQEPEDLNRALNQPRIVVLARAFNQLSPEDAANDPYRNHPIIGTTRFNIMGLVYDALDNNHVHMLVPDNIVSHIAVCGFADPAGLMSAPCAVVVDLDMKHVFHS